MSFRLLSKPTGDSQRGTKHTFMPENLKVLRVVDECHMMAKIQATKQGLKLQAYMERLIRAAEQGLVDWEKLKEQ